MNGRRGRIKRRPTLMALIPFSSPLVLISRYARSRDTARSSAASSTRIVAGCVLVLIMLASIAEACYVDYNQSFGIKAG